MGGWRRHYGELSGPRYPNLIAYAQLLTGSRDTADALVQHALRRTFGRVRRLGTAAQVEEEVRRAIVARLLATAEPEGAAVAPAPVAAAAAPPKPVKQPEVDPALYAPPGTLPTETELRAHLHMDSADVTAPGALQTGPPDKEDPEPALPCAERSGGAVSESDQTHSALATLTPQARAITVLRHYEGLAPGLIAVQLGLEPAAVVEQLRTSHTVLRAHLGITIADEPDHTTSPTGDGAYEITVTPHTRSR